MTLLTYRSLFILSTVISITSKTSYSAAIEDDSPQRNLSTTTVFEQKLSANNMVELLKLYANFDAATKRGFNNTRENPWDSEGDPVLESLRAMGSFVYSNQQVVTTADPKACTIFVEAAEVEEGESSIRENQ